MKKRTAAHRAVVERECREADEVVEALRNELSAEEHALLCAEVEAWKAAKREMAKEHPCLERLVELVPALADNAIERALATVEKKRGLR